MKRLLAAAAAGILALNAQAPVDDPLLKAMRDEVARSKKLTLNNLEAPYFVQYLVDESESFSVSATLGGLIGKRRDRYREPETRVRVGDYKFDNSNFTGGGFNFGSRYDLSRFPVENSYPVMRRYLWLETDSAYKAAGGRHFAQAGGAAEPHAERDLERLCARRAGQEDRDFPEADHRRRFVDQSRARPFGGVLAIPGREEFERGTRNQRRRVHDGEQRRHRSAGAGRTCRMCGRGRSRRRPTA